MTSDMSGIDCFRPFRANVSVLHNNRALPCFAAIAPLGHSWAQYNSLINQLLHAMYHLLNSLPFNSKF